LSRGLLFELYTLHQAPTARSELFIVSNKESPVTHLQILLYPTASHRLFCLLSTSAPLSRDLPRCFETHSRRTRLYHRTRSQAWICPPPTPFTLLWSPFLNRPPSRYKNFPSNAPLYVNAYFLTVFTFYQTAHRRPFISFSYQRIPVPLKPHTPRPLAQQKILPFNRSLTQKHSCLTSLFLHPDPQKLTPQNCTILLDCARFSCFPSTHYNTPTMKYFYEIPFIRGYISAGKRAPAPLTSRPPHSLALFACPSLPLPLPPPLLTPMATPLQNPQHTNHNNTPPYKKKNTHPDRAMHWPPHPNIRASPVSYFWPLSLSAFLFAAFPPPHLRTLPPPPLPKLDFFTPSDWYAPYCSLGARYIPTFVFSQCPATWGSLPPLFRFALPFFLLFEPRTRSKAPLIHCFLFFPKHK